MTSIPTKTLPETPTLPETDLQTQLIHGGYDRSPHGETSEALYLTSGFVYDSAEQAQARFQGAEGEADKFIYSRYGNPTVRIFEERLRLIEGAEVCVATASGMAAMAGSLLSHLQAGDHVVASRVLFGSCLQVLTTYLPRFGIEVTLVDGTDLDAWAGAIRTGQTRALFCETPANPTLALVDLQGVADLAHGAGALLIVDNAFASPAVQLPMDFGADIVTYSATKHMDGQGRCMGGAILCSQAFYGQYLEHYMRHLGPCLSPFNAWSLAKSLETLDLRVERMVNTAQQIAEALEACPTVARVHYPGLKTHSQHALAAQQMHRYGSLLAFEVAGGQAQAFRVLNALNLVLISNNLGDSKTLATHPATTTHRTLSEGARAEAGIGDGLIRLSLGLESVRDIEADVLQALSLSA